MKTINFCLDEQQENFFAKLSVDEAREHGIPIPDVTECSVGFSYSTFTGAVFDWVMEGADLILHISVPRNAMTNAADGISGAAKMSNGYLFYSGRIAQ